MFEDTSIVDRSRCRYILPNIAFEQYFSDEKLI